MNSPVISIQSYYEKAKAINDPMSQYATFITLDEQNIPASRTITIRSLRIDGISLIVNEASPKAIHLQKNHKYELLIFWPLLKIQYRVRGSFRFESDKKLEIEWKAKSKNSRIIDMFHSRSNQQSSKINNHDQFVLDVKKFGERLTESELELPRTVKRLILIPNFVEEWIGSSEDRLHRRTAFSYDGNIWHQQSLVP